MVTGSREKDESSKNPFAKNHWYAELLLKNMQDICRIHFKNLHLFINSDFFSKPYIQYSVLSNTFVEEKSLTQNLKKQFLEVA